MVKLVSRAGRTCLTGGLPSSVGPKGIALGVKCATVCKWLKHWDRLREKSSREFNKAESKNLGRKDKQLEKIQKYHGALLIERLKASAE